MARTERQTHTGQVRVTSTMKRCDVTKGLLLGMIRADKMVIKWS